MFNGFRKVIGRSIRSPFMSKGFFGNELNGRLPLKKCLDLRILIEYYESKRQRKPPKSPRDQEDIALNQRGKHNCGLMKLVLNQYMSEAKIAMTIKMRITYYGEE